MSDNELFPRRLQPRLRFSRAPKTNLDHVEESRRPPFFESWGSQGSRLQLENFTAASANISPSTPQAAGILRSAYECNVPVFVPAFFRFPSSALDFALNKYGPPSATTVRSSASIPFEDFEKIRQTP